VTCPGFVCTYSNIITECGCRPCVCKTEMLTRLWISW